MCQSGTIYANLVNNDECVINEKNLSSHLVSRMAQLRDKKLLQRIALVLKDLRQEFDLSQEDVYNETNIHIGRIESSDANVTVSTLAILLRFFDISLTDFFRRVESRR